jgi:hypothetical protein
MAFVMFEVIVGEQNLRDPQLELGEEFFVNGHQPRLAYSSTSLQFRQVGRPFGVSKQPHAGPDGAGGDDDDFLALFVESGELGDQLLHLAKVGLLPAVGQDAGSEFGHDPCDLFKELRTHGQVGSKPGRKCRG